MKCGTKVVDYMVYMYTIENIPLIQENQKAFRVIVRNDEKGTSASPFVALGGDVDLCVWSTGSDGF